jgi:indole-3-glycerol phosphate synthase
MATILERIVESKRGEVAAAKASVPEVTLRRRTESLPAPRDFFAAVTAPGEVRVIAEVKKASPSVGLIRPDFDAVAVARAYESNGAAALSVLTDGRFFQGSLADLTAVRDAVGVPCLRKEFVIDEYQLLEARAAGADAVLLIAEILPGQRLQQLRTAAMALGLGVLIEFHDADQLVRVLDVGATLVGINNRDLRTFETRLSHTLDLMASIPSTVAVVAESGIKTHDDLVTLGRAGVRAVLVGESLMRQANVGEALRRLRGKEATHDEPDAEPRPQPE